MNYMLVSDHSKFFKYVQKYIEKNPSAAAHISDHVAKGLIAASSELVSKNLDLESTLMLVYTTKNLSKKKELISGLINKYPSMNFSWSSLLGSRTE